MQFSLRDSTTCAIKHAPATGNDTTLLFLRPADLESVDGTTVIGKLHKSFEVMQLSIKFTAEIQISEIVATCSDGGAATALSATTISYYFQVRMIFKM